MTDNMRQIIYVWNYLSWGGVQIYFMSLMKEAKRSYPVTSLIPVDSEPKILRYLDPLDISLEFLPSPPQIERKPGMLGKLSRRLDLLISEYKLANKILERDGLRDTIVQVDLGFWQSFIPLFRLCLRTNVFMTVHTGLPLLTGVRGLLWRAKGKILSRFSTFHLLASNIDARNSLKAYLGAKKFDEIEVTYTGFDPDELAAVNSGPTGSSNVRERYGLPKDRPVLMTVGQFIERKGCWVLLESLKQVKEAGDDLVFVWLSTRLPDASMLERISQYGLGDRFRVMDAAEIGETREDLLTLLSSADGFVLASLEEGLPIALIEAMALGLPCIATSINAVPEAIEDGKTGFLVPPNDAIRLKEAMIQVLQNAKQTQKLGEAAKQVAFEKFNGQITARRTVKLYEAVWKTND